MWYLTSHHHTINDRASHRQGVHRIPDVWSKFSGYDEYTKKKKTAPKMNGSILNTHGETLLGICQRPSISGSAWSTMVKDIQSLAAACLSYAKFLDEERVDQNKRQALNHPVRQVGLRDTPLRFFPHLKKNCMTRIYISYLKMEHFDSLFFTKVFLEKLRFKLVRTCQCFFFVQVSEFADIQVLVGSCGEIAKEYRLLDQAVRELQIGEHFFFDENIHVSAPMEPQERFWFLKKLHLSVNVDILRYVGFCCFN